VWVSVSQREGGGSPPPTQRLCAQGRRTVLCGDHASSGRQCGYGGLGLPCVPLKMILSEDVCGKAQLLVLEMWLRVGKRGGGRKDQRSLTLLLVLEELRGGRERKEWVKL
jgi:hypothetical protein